MYYFCTYFDRNYLDKGLALYYSLVRHCQPFNLWVLCMNNETYLDVSRLRLPGLTPISLPHFENDDPKLLEAKKNRSLIEYYFTCTPSLILKVIQKNPEIDVLTYLDADLYFFGSVEPAYKELGSGSILLIEHRFAHNLKDAEQYGHYNVGLLSFRNDANGLAALTWWRDRCLEWCYDRVEDGKFADQKYLDDWTNRFKGVVVLQHKGIGLAPYNFANYDYSAKDLTFRLFQAPVKIYVDQYPLIMYHFHGVKQRMKKIWDMDVYASKTPLPDVIKNKVYLQYIKELIRIREECVEQGIGPRPNLNKPIRTYRVPPVIDIIKTNIIALKKHIYGDFIEVLS